MEERSGAATFLNEPFTLVGKEIAVGDRPASFETLTPAMATYSLDDGTGTVRLIAAVPSLDTPVCDAEVCRLSESQLPDDVRIVVVSADLPFAQERWRRDRRIDNITFVSDHRDLSFGKSFGILVKELRLLGRAIFVLDPENEVTYVEYVRELTDHPDYKAALDALEDTVGREAA